MRTTCVFLMVVSLFFGMISCTKSRHLTGPDTPPTDVEVNLTPPLGSQELVLRKTTGYFPSGGDPCTQDNPCSRISWELKCDNISYNFIGMRPVTVGDPNPTLWNRRFPVVPASEYSGKRVLLTFWALTGGPSNSGVEQVEVSGTITIEGGSPLLSCGEADTCMENTPGDHSCDSYLDTNHAWSIGDGSSFVSLTSTSSTWTDFPTTTAPYIRFTLSFDATVIYNGNVLNDNLIILGLTPE